MIGYHINEINKNGVKKSFDALKNTFENPPAAQIFTVGPQSHHEIFTSDALKEIRKQKTKIVIHTSYLNQPFASDKKRGLSIWLTKKEIEAAKTCGAVGIVIHLGRFARDQSIVDWFMSHIREHLGDIIIYLELNSSKKESFIDPDDISRTIKRFKHKNIGLCVDTAHLFASGLDISTAPVAKKFLDGLDVKHIMFHLNDNYTALGSGRDEHAALCHGVIWKDFHPTSGHRPIADSGLQVFAEYIRANNSICILEQDHKAVLQDLFVLSHI